MITITLRIQVYNYGLYQLYFRRELSFLPGMQITSDIKLIPFPRFTLRFGLNITYTPNQIEGRKGRAGVLIFGDVLHFREAPI